MLSLIQAIEHFAFEANGAKMGSSKARHCSRWDKVVAEAVFALGVQRERVSRVLEQSIAIPDAGAVSGDFHKAHTMGSHQWQDVGLNEFFGVLELVSSLGG